MKKEQKNNKNKIAFVCFLIASICFYISAIIDIINKDGSNWAVNLCLGSTFLCLSTTPEMRPVLEWLIYEMSLYWEKKNVLFFFPCRYK